MALFEKFRSGLRNTQAKLVHEIKRIITRSPKMTEVDGEELEQALIAADFGVRMAGEIVKAARTLHESQGRASGSVFSAAREEVEKALSGLSPDLVARPGELTVVSLVGVNGAGKTTTTAKLAHWLQSQGKECVLAACDTFRAAAIEQLKLWGQRLEVPVVAGNYGADPSAVAHDAVKAALARHADYLLVDTAGRLHTKNNLMQELQKLNRVMGKLLPGAPHETLLVLDGTTGMNAASQAREFAKTVPLTGLVITKLDGTSRGGMVVAVQKEMEIPVKFVGVGEQPGDLQPFQAKAFAAALFPDDDG